MLEECLCCCEERAENHRLPGFIYRDNKIRKSPKHSKLLEILQVLSWSRNPLTNLHSTSRYFFSLLLKINLYSLLHFKHHTNRLLYDLALLKRERQIQGMFQVAKPNYFLTWDFNYVLPFKMRFAMRISLVMGMPYVIYNEKTITSQGEADAFIYVKIRLKL